MNTDQREWLADLYGSHFAAVHRVCSRVLRNPEDAADVSQEVFLTAANSLQPGTGSQASRAWLLTVARNHSLDLLRRQKRFGRALTTLGADSDLGPDIETAVADRDFVDTLLKQLSSRERQALWQSAVDGRSLTDIARRLKLSYMAAAQVVHRARRHALAMASRVAIVLGGIRLLGRRQHGSLVGAHQLLVAAAIPLIVVAMQSSGPSVPAQAAATAPTQGSSPAVAGTATRAGQPSGPLAISASASSAGVLGSSQTALPSVPLPVGATSTLSSAAETLRRLAPIPLLPSSAVPPVIPSSSVPPIP